MKGIPVKVKLLVTIVLVSLIPLMVSGFLNFKTSSEGIYELTVYDLNYITHVKANELDYFLEDTQITENENSKIKEIIQEIQNEYYKDNGLEGYGYIMDGNGIMLEHPDSNLVGTDMTQYPFAREIVSQKEGYIEYDWEGRTKVAAFHPLKNGWILVVGSYLDDLMKPATKIKYEMFIISLISGIISLLVGLFIVLRITQPIKRLVQAMEKAEQGDLTVQVPVKSKDEIGQQSQMFNDMMQNFRRMLTEVYEVSQSVASSSEELTASASESAKASEQISIVATDIAQGSEKQMESVFKTSDHIQESSRSLQKISENVNKVNQDSEKATQIAHDGRIAMHKMSNEMGEISSKVHSTELVVRQLGSYSDSISGIITTIREISDQTNLLSLNAAIEAARAGEQGRSFAVVAQEVRKLAEQSSSSAEEIEQLINTIRHEIGRAVTAMEESSKAVEDGLVIADGANKSFADILTAIEGVNREVQAVTIAAEQITRDSKIVVEQANAISKLAERATADTEEVAAASEQQTATMQEITAASDTLSHMAEQLQNLVARFKI